MNKKLGQAVNVGETSEIPSLLQEDGCANINSVNKNGESLLHLAVRNGHSQIARMLLDNGANIDAQDSRGMTPLHIAADLGDSMLARSLVARHANSSIKNYNGYTPKAIALMHLDEWRIIKAKNEIKNKMLTKCVLKAMGEMNTEDVIDES